MRVDPRDVQEALYQAPGEQVAELGKAICDLRATLAAGSLDAHRDELDKRLRFLAERAAEIEPVVELLHEFVEAATLRQGLLRHEERVPTPFILKVQPPYAAALLFRLAAAREDDDDPKAKCARDVIAMYAKDSQIRAVRDALVDGLRADALAHGETQSGYFIGSVEDLRKELLTSTSA